MQRSQQLQYSKCALLFKTQQRILQHTQIIHDFTNSYIKYVLLGKWDIPYVGNFGGGKFWRNNSSKVFGEEKFGESVGSLLKTLAFINIGEENFGELPTVHQIRQNFPTYGSLYHV